MRDIRSILKYWLILLIGASFLTCEENEPPGYEIESLYEVNGKERIDRTTEVTSCRMTDRWIFDLPNRHYITDILHGDCDTYYVENGRSGICDTTYIDSLKGTYLNLYIWGIFQLMSPIVHPEFPMEVLKNEYKGRNETHILRYRIIKFDQEKLILLNKFNPTQVPRDSQYFELKMKFVKD